MLHMNNIRPMTARNIIDLLQAKRNLRSARALAVEMKVSHGYLCDVLAGKRDPGPSILDYLGLEKRSQTLTVYVPKGKKK